MATPPSLDIRAELPKIRDKGPIKTLRKGATGIGKTIETLLGIQENNLGTADFFLDGVKVELKAQRKDTSSKITLFTLEPTKPGGDKSLIQNYGYKDIKGRRALKVTFTTGTANQQGLILEVNDTSKKIIVKDSQSKEICSWDFAEIENKLNEKITSNLCLVFADSSNKSGDEYLHYNEAYLLKDLTLVNFLAALRDGRIVVEFRMHMKANGSVRNHGTAFRMNEGELMKLYATTEKLT